MNILIGLLLSIFSSINVSADEVYLVREPTGQCLLQVPEGPYNPQFQRGIRLSDVLSFISKSPQNQKLIQELLGTTESLEAALKAKAEKNGFIRLVGSCESLNRAQMILTNSGVFGPNPTMTCYLRTRSWEFVVPSAKLGPYMKVYEITGSSGVAKAVITLRNWRLSH